MEYVFPLLRGTNYHETSPPDRKYNCIAWAAEDQCRWWDNPIHRHYWPPTSKFSPNIDSLVEAYRTLGYEVCSDESLEEGFQKVALYSLDGEWTHAARQLSCGLWTSKLGKGKDITHEHPDHLSDSPYGYVYCYMKREAF
jgi:hypothetical protein